MGSRFVHQHWRPNLQASLDPYTVHAAWEVSLNNTANPQVLNTFIFNNKSLFLLLSCWLTGNYFHRPPERTQKTSFLTFSMLVGKVWVSTETTQVLAVVLGWGGGASSIGCQHLPGLVIVIRDLQHLPCSLT